MNTIQPANKPEFDHNSQHEPLTEQQKLNNIAEGWKTFLEILNEKLANGGLNNAINS